MSLRPYKFQIIAVCQVIEDDEVKGEELVGNQNGEPVTVFGLAGLRAFADDFEGWLTVAEQSRNGSAA
jgi:hypothetical protein